MFVKKRGGKITVLIVYVDDIVITGNDTCEIADVKRRLASEFEMKDLGKLWYFLGIEVSRSPGGIFLSQRKYTLDLLNETGMLGCRPADSPIEVNHKLCGNVGDTVDKFQYQRLVGRLIYLSHTRPDIAYAVGVVNRYMHDPRQPHLDAVYMILRYLKAAPGKGVMFTNNNHLEVESYTDADWAGCLDDRRSTSGYCTFVRGNIVTWRSKKQPVVALSSAEAEYRAMARGVRELLWIKLFLTELGLATATPLKLYCDNKAAIAIAHDPGSWTKRAADVDSPNQVSLQDQHQSADTPDSTCAQVIHTKPEICSSCTQTKGFKEQEKGLDLELCISKFPDTHLEHHSLCSSHALSDKQDKASVLDSCVRCNKLFDHKSESTKNRKLDHSENLITLLANDGNKSTESRAIEPPTDMSNVSRNKVPASSGSRTSLDFCLKGQESAENVKTATLDGTNVLRHSDLSAFSKYNCASSDSQAPTAKVGSCSPPDNSSYALKTGMMPNSQSISAFKCFQASAAQQVEHTCLPPSTKNDGTTPGKEEAHAKDSDQQFVQHHHHHYHHYHHHVQELHPQAKEDHEGYLMTNQMVDASRCGSSNMLDGHVEGNATFRNLVGSDNNRASIGRNGSSNESNVGVTNMESDNGEKVNSGVNSINQGANGGGANKDCSSQREAALKKFRQKRKERCFEKKVRYQSRKKLAEQRPRIRGQFVRTESDDKAGIEKQDNLLLKDGSSNSIE